MDLLAVVISSVALIASGVAVFRGRPSRSGGTQVNIYSEVPEPARDVPSWIAALPPDPPRQPPLPPAPSPPVPDPDPPLFPLPRRQTQSARTPRNDEPNVIDARHRFWKPQSKRPG